MMSTPVAGVWCNARPDRNGGRGVQASDATMRIRRGDRPTACRRLTRLPRHALSKTKGSMMHYLLFYDYADDYLTRRTAHQSRAPQTRVGCR